MISCMPADPIRRRTLQISRADIESGNVADVARLLRTQIRDREAAYLTRGRLRLTIHGWDDDPRELWEIAEVREFMVRVDAEFPYWYWFLEPCGSMLLLAACCCEQVPGAGLKGPDRIAVAIMPEVLMRYLDTRYQASVQLAREIGLEQADVVDCFRVAAFWFGLPDPFPPGGPANSG